MAIRMQGKHVEGLRAALGLGVAQFAAVLGVHPSTVHRWEGAQKGEVVIDGVAANILVSLARKVDEDRKARQQATQIGDEIGKALLLSGALVALAVLVNWLTENRR